MFYKFISIYKFIFLYIIYLYVVYILYDQKNVLKDKYLKHDRSSTAVNVWVSEMEQQV